MPTPNPANEIDVGKIKLVWKGTYNNSTEYEVDDLVVYEDGLTISSYICIQDSVGNVPSTSGSVNTSYWNIAAKGSSASASGIADGEVQFKSGTGFGSNSLFILDSANNRLGVNTSSPSSNLDVRGNTESVNLIAERLNVTGISTFSDTLNISEVIQNVNIVSGPANGTSDIDVKTSSVWIFTSNSTGTWTHNIRGDASTSLDSLMSEGQVITIKVISKQNNTAYYSSNITIDGAAQTEYWRNGVYSSGSSTTGYDSYSWTIIKTGSASFIVLATMN